MLRHIISIALMISPLLSVSPASGDPWKDENGHGRHWKEWEGGKEGWGETPWWGRGKGYWDGHFKHGQWGPPVYGPPRYFEAPPRQYFSYAPPPPPEFYFEYEWPHEGFEELPPPLPHWRH